MIVLVTGASGSVGEHVMTALARDGRATARGMTRREPVPAAELRVEWAVADLASGEGVEEAVAGVDAIVHLASDYPRPDSDVPATRTLLALAAAAGVSHFTYLSIVGIERIPLPYYGWKVAAERIVREAAVPWTIVRSTQFHSFVDHYLATLAGLPIPGVLPATLLFQTVDEQEVGERLARLTLDAPNDESIAGREIEIAGPEVLPLAEMAAAWYDARRRPRTALPVELREASMGFEPEAWVGEVLTGFARGENTPAGAHERGEVTWHAYVARRYGSS